jgi:hypothetical protein
MDGESEADHTRRVISGLYAEVERVAEMAITLPDEPLNLRRTALEISTNSYAMLRELAMTLEALELLEAGVETPITAMGVVGQPERLTPRQVLLLAQPRRG